MKVKLELESDSYNSYPIEELEFEFFNDGIRQNYIWLKVGDREVSVRKDEFKKVLSIV